MTYCLDPRPLSPPPDWDLCFEPVLLPFWHFVAEDGHEDYVLHEDELPAMTNVYVALGVPFTVTRDYRD